MQQFVDFLVLSNNCTLILFSFRLFHTLPLFIVSLSRTYKNQHFYCIFQIIQKVTVNRNKSLLFLSLHISALFIGAYQTAAFFQHISSAFGTFFRRWTLPGHEITFRIIFTAIIPAAFFVFFRITSPPHLGHLTPIFSRYGFVFLHSGKPGQARNFP